MQWGFYSNCNAFAAFNVKKVDIGKHMKMHHEEPLSEACYKAFDKPYFTQ